MSQEEIHPQLMRRQPQQARSQQRVNRILDEAEQLLIEVGYEATTTKAIAANAEIPIGTLYQFFPGKPAIVTAIAMRYAEQLQQLFSELHTSESATLPLEEYLDRTIETFHQFYATHPGLIIVFGQLPQIAPDIQTVNAEFNLQIQQRVAEFFLQYNPNLDPAQAELIAKIGSEVTRTLHVAALVAQDKTEQQQILTEAKTLLFSYLQPHLCKRSDQG